LVTFGQDRDDALSRAIGAFEEAIEARIADREEIPLPSKFKTSAPHVTLPVQAEVKVLLYQQMWKSGVRKADLARKMDLHRQQIDRLLDLNHATSIAKLETAFSVVPTASATACRTLRRSGPWLGVRARAGPAS
jgi:antitoxin HicB